MTKEFNLKATCPNCGERMTMETGFCRWMRNNPRLDSANGIIRCDQDHWVLRYKTPHNGRDVQLLMLIEVKEFNAVPDKAQSDCLRMLHRFHSDTGKNIYGATTHRTKMVFSDLSGRTIRLRNLGVHLLQFSRTNPEDSLTIRWDHKEIDIQTLESLLLLDLNPNNPEQSMDELLRDRHKKPMILDLFPVQRVEEVRLPKGWKANLV